MKRWKLKSTPEIGSNDIEFTCHTCGVDSLLPVLGNPIAQVGMGLVGDQQPVETPAYIKCPNCHKEYERHDAPTR